MNISVSAILLQINNFEDVMQKQFFNDIKFNSIVEIYINHVSIVTEALQLLHIFHLCVCPWWLEMPTIQCACPEDVFSFTAHRIKINK